MIEKISTVKFKAECHQVIEKVRKTGKKIIITKRNIPIAQIGPVDGEEKAVFGKLKGTIQYLDNSIDHIDEIWEADPI